MQEELYGKSLNEETSKDIEIYNPNKLFYASFFGGIIPTIVLSTKNANWLKKDKRITTVIGILGSLILFAKLIVSSMVLNGAWLIESRYIRYGYRIGCVCLYLCYYYFMKSSFTQHYVLEGETRPLLKDAIKWVLIGSVIELILIIAGRLIVGILI